MAQALMNGQPKSGELSRMAVELPGRRRRILRPVSQGVVRLRWKKFPAHVTLEQFSPVIPDNYRESSYPVAVYRWHAENPTDKTVTVSVMLSWTNMAAGFAPSLATLPELRTRGTTTITAASQSKAAR